MTKPRAKYLKKVFHRLWFSNWSSGEHLRILNRVIFGRKGA